MIRADLHVHTVFSDGKSTPEEYVKAALAMGMTRLGFSDHSYTPFDESYCIPRARVQEYRDCIAALKEQYAGRLEILCGVEQDLYSGRPTEKYDYVIGSVHYLKLGDEYVPVDESPDILRGAAERFFGGDMYALAAEYYRTVAQVADCTGCDIIGHFDLTAKFCERSALLDESDRRYTECAEAAALSLIKTGLPFEINTGAVSRGHRSEPYPSLRLIDFIKDHGGRFILSSDSHCADTLCGHFGEYGMYVHDR